MKRPELSHDGHGINGPDEFRERVATFTRFEYSDRYGPLFAAAPELLAALKDAWAYIPHLYQAANGRILPMNSTIRKTITEALARAEGRTE